MSAVDRRAFLCRTCSAALALPLAGLAGACASLVVRTIEPVNGTLRLALSRYPELAEPTGSLSVRPGGSDDAIYIFANGSGQFAALSPVCTHRGCIVEMGDTRLVCPCHGSTYDREGQVVRGPAQRPLERYATEVSDGVLV